jgi:NADH:ubiquinone oxidoreductase subunit 2 (subunit N)
MVVNSVIGLSYYLAVAKQMIFFEAPEGARRVASPLLVSAMIALGTAAVVAVGVFPDLLAKFPPTSTLIGH